MPPTWAGWYPNSDWQHVSLAQKEEQMQLLWALTDKTGTTHQSEGAKASQPGAQTLRKPVKATRSPPRSVHPPKGPAVVSKAKPTHPKKCPVLPASPCLCFTGCPTHMLTAWTSRRMSGNHKLPLSYSPVALAQLSAFQEWTRQGAWLAHMSNRPPWSPNLLREPVQLDQDSDIDVTQFVRFETH